MVTKADLAVNTPKLSDLNEVAQGDNVSADIENVNNQRLLNQIIRLFAWVADSAIEATSVISFTGIITFLAGIRTNLIQNLAGNQNIVIKPNSGKVFINDDAVPGNEFLTKQTGLDVIEDIETAEEAAAAALASVTTQAGIATTQAGIATTQAGIATTQATNAGTSATTATTQAGIATTQAGIATTQATNASTSASTATTQASTATTQAGIATTQAGIATTQAGIATTQATNASTSASTATTQASTATTQAGIATTQAGIATAAAAVTRMGQFYLNACDNVTIPLISSSRFAFTINRLFGLKTSTGTITAAIQINGVNVTGLSSLAVTSTASSPTATAANTVAIGDRVSLVLTSNSGAVNLEFTMGAS